MAKSGGASIRTRVSLLEGIKDPQNQKRWTEFNNLYSGFIRGVAIRSGARQEDADDIAQSVLIEVSRKIGEFRYDPARGRFRSWLSTVIRFKCLETFRKDKRAQDRIEKISPPTIRVNRKTTVVPQEYSESEHDRIVEDEWRRAVLSATRDRVRALVPKAQFQLYDCYVRDEWPVDKVVRTYGVTANMVFLAKSKVGKIFEEQARIVMAEMDSPSIPPEHPLMASE